MSSAPAQFLIYVLPTPTCPIPPVIMPATDCFEILAGIPTDIQLLVVNNCNPTVADISDVIMSKTLSGLDMTDMAALPTNDSLILVEFNFTSQSNQIGPQTFCVIAYTEEQVQSAEYCVTLNQPAQLRPHRRPPQQQRAQQHQRVRQPQAQQAQQLQQLQQLQARLLQRPRRQQQPQLQQPQLQRRQQPQLQRRQQPQLPRRQQPQLQRRQQLQQQLQRPKQRQIPQVSISGYISNRQITN
ncbi:unnamed protein product [Rotaria socialis]|uniref:Uncharacterized protein n=1 Tax=Rotaria socialis TaxID=392032 RepID=A0A818UUS3_9BILA|nr:unnamed protein product [Rotaria socialis]